MQEKTQAPAIIISNGRCGSTLLSDLIAEEPDTLSVQEFFMTMAPLAKTDATLSGPEYWEMLSGAKAELATLVRIGRLPKEVRYPRTGRWGADLTQLPRVSAITLSKISADPDAMFDVLAERVPKFPRQPAGEHHQMFLDLLTTLTGRRRWVERSGGSSYVAPFLLQTFPHARFVYLTRNWHDTALSMSRHSSFQLIQLRLESVGRYGFDPFRVEPGDPVPQEMVDYLPDRLTAEALQERGQHLQRYIALCAFFSSQAEQALADMPPAHLHTMRYEDLVANPVTELERLGEFLQFDDWAGWARQMADRVIDPAAKRQTTAA